MRDGGLIGGTEVQQRAEQAAVRGLVERLSIEPRTTPRGGYG